MGEESHLDDMRSAIRGDFDRLAERRGEQQLMRLRRTGGAGADRARRRGRAGTAIMVHSVDLALSAAASSNPVGEEGRARPDHAPGDRPSRDATPASREGRTGGGSPLDTADRATTPSPGAKLPPERRHLPRRDPRPAPVHASPAGDRAANGGSRTRRCGRHGASWRTSARATLLVFADVGSPRPGTLHSTR